jgi:5-methylcytosine-specific restriction endonuclease McrA
MKIVKDITGQKFSNLTATRFVYKKLKSNSTRYTFFYEFLCDCGNIKTLNKNNVVRGTTTSCGCSRKKHIKNLSGQKFGLLTIISRNKDKDGKLLTTYTCKCQCGNITITPEGRKLENGAVKSCGCLRPLSNYVGYIFGNLKVVKKLPSKNNKSQYKCECSCGKTTKKSIQSLLNGIKSCGCILVKINKSKEKRNKHSMRMRGKNNPSWKGGILYERPEWQVKKWRKSVYDRDLYTCQCCEVKGGRLNAHHILAYKTNVSERFNINNGITLCERCHINFHKKYGKLNFTLENLIDFMQNFNKKTYV